MEAGREQAWALLSVSDKRGLGELARWLKGQGLGLMASGGTQRALVEQGISARPLEDLTGFAELLGGRVKTLHPRIYAGLLSRETPADWEDRHRMEAPAFAVVVVNLYPFSQRWQAGADLETLVEEIDIGGVSLIRAAAKNYQRILVVTHPDQYPRLMSRALGEWSEAERLGWAVEAFYHMAHYDATIARALAAKSSQRLTPQFWALSGEREGSLRYGENPHQWGGLYRVPGEQGVATARQHQGKALSYNNLADADMAWRLAAALPRPAAVAVKHQTPCGVALGATVSDAFVRARDADPVSIFGGIVAFNAPVDATLAELLTDLFLEVVVAPGYSDQALAKLGQKTNLRVLEVTSGEGPGEEVRRIGGGILVQEPDRFAVPPAGFQHVAGPPLDPALLADLDLAWRTVAFVRSNAIVVVRDGVTVGIGGGQTNRIDAARQALERAGERARGGVLASDAFFPFGDVMAQAAQAGIRAVVEPGGSVRDQESVAVAESSGVTLLFTGERHFRH
ncbi:MAG: bifunctional phosphoribosylaminoimidazolecarboxamide formyltransferase/IMP cyclohydrolase [Firmicutes bacterium]|nr:bifunctional phosphoribosylaminoimidazolecarboxamide formyltransferase/IMP cyclohydrolase [Bacillota bacterium]